MMPVLILAGMEINISNSVGDEYSILVTVYVEGNDQCTGLAVILSGDAV